MLSNDDRLSTRLYSSARNLSTRKITIIEHVIVSTRGMHAQALHAIQAPKRENKHVHDASSKRVFSSCTCFSATYHHRGPPLLGESFFTPRRYIVLMHSRRKMTSIITPIQVTAYRRQTSQAPPPPRPNTTDDYQRRYRFE